MRKIAASLLILLALCCGSRAQQTQAGINTAIGTDLPSCGDQCISAALLRGVLTQMNDAIFQFPGSYIGSTCPSSLVPYQFSVNTTGGPTANTYNVFNPVSSTCLPWMTFNQTAGTFNFIGSMNGVNITGTPAIGWVPLATSTSAASWQKSIALSIIAFGADPTGAADSTSAINAALTAAANAAGTANCVYVPGGIYKISGELTISASGGCLIGDGPYASVIQTTSAVANIIRVTSAANGYYVANLGVQSTAATPTAGAGVAIDSGPYAGTIYNVMSTATFYGFNLGGSGFGTCITCVAVHAFSHGFFFTNTMTYGQMQWQMINANASANNGWGYYIFSTVAGQYAAPNFTESQSFDNTGGGVLFDGVSGTRFTDNLFSNFISSGDGGGGGIVANKIGGNFRITDVFVESAGQFATGRTPQTAAANTGAGVSVTGVAGSAGVQSPNIILKGIISRGNSDQGIVLTSAGSVVNATLGDIQATTNGKGSTAGNRIGVDLANSTTIYQLNNVVSYNDSNDTGGSGPQTYGLRAAVASNVFLGNGNYAGTSGGCLATTGTFNGTSNGTGCRGNLSVAGLTSSGNADFQSNGDGSFVMGTSGTTISAQVPVSFHMASDQNLYVAGAFDLGGGVFIGSVNDAASAFTGIEFKAAQVYFNTAIGPVSIGTTSTTATALNTSGTVDMAGLPTSTPGGTPSTVCWDSTHGALWTDGSATGPCGIASAIRFKDLLPQAALNIAGMSELRTDVPWKYKPGGRDSDQVHVGLFADDVEKLDPRCVDRDEKGVTNYDNRCIIAYLVAARNADKAEFDEYRRTHP
jgi:hypothetical protein